MRETRENLALLGALMLTLTVAAAACARDSRSASPTGGSSPWQKVRPLGSGGFPPEPGSSDRPKWTPGKIPVTVQPIQAFNGDLWMTSQTNAWSSSNGLDWNHYVKTDTGERIWQAKTFFKSRLWSFGGLRYSNRLPVNEIWSSADGTHWARSGTAAWTPRKQHTVAVFRDKLWLFGGADKVKPDDFTTQHILNDVWSSSDGSSWTRVTDNAPWSAREGARVVVLNDALYMVGGEKKNDVWRSADGAHWTQVSAAAPWTSREGYGAISFAGKLWVYGGWIGKTTNAVNDVWSSSDGASWTRQTEHASWGPRSPLSVVFENKLWIYSGKHTGAKDSWGGDVWTMSAAA